MQATRKASFQLLCQLRETYELPLVTIPSGSTELSALFIPSNLVHYCVSISSEIAVFRPEYCREFIMETFLALKRPVNSQKQKIALILCVAPWIPYLGLYLDYAHEQDSILSTRAHTVMEDRDEKFSVDDQTVSGSSSPIMTLSSSSSTSLGSVSSSNSSPRPIATTSRTPSSISHSQSVGAHSNKVKLLHGGLIHNSNIKTKEIRSSLLSPGMNRHSSGNEDSAADDSNSAKVKYDFLGSRITNATSENLRQEIENIIEIVVHCSREDEALATVFYLQFWDNVGFLPNVCSLAMNYFIKRLSHEAIQHGSAVSEPLKGAKKHEGENVAASGTGKPPNKHHKENEFALKVDDVLVPPFSLHGFEIMDQTCGGTALNSRTTPLNKLSIYSLQGQCAYCITMCEAIALLASKDFEQSSQHHPQLPQPVALCMQLVNKIQELVEEILNENLQNDRTIDLTQNSEGMNSFPTINFNFDINDGYIKNPKHDQGKNQGDDSDDMFSRFSTTTGKNIHFVPSRESGAVQHHNEPKKINTQLFAGTDGDNNQDKGNDITSSATTVNSNSTTNSTTMDKNLRRNLESFFTLPVPPSPSTTPQKLKNSNTESHVRPPGKSEQSENNSSKQNSAASAVLDMSLNSKWVEVISLLRPILYVIGHNIFVLEHCTPALLHMCLELLAKAPRSARPGVFALLSSLIHSLMSESSTEYDVSQNKSGMMSRNTLTEGNDDYGVSHSHQGSTESAIIFSEATTLKWKDICAQLDSPVFHHIFNKTPELTSLNFELVVGLISDVVACPSSILSSKWKQNLWDIAYLFSGKLFTHSIKIVVNSGGSCGNMVIRASCTVYPSNYYLMGNLIDRQKADRDYFQQMVSAFHDVIKLCGEYNFVVGMHEVQKELNNIEDKILRPLSFCLNCSLKYMELLELQRLFWCVILLLQYFPEHFLSGPVLILHGIVDELLQKSTPVEGLRVATSNKDEELKIDSSNITSALLVTRESDSTLKEIFDVLEGSSILGISFKSSFSTALTSTLLRVFNVKDVQTKGLAIDILQKLLQHDQKTYVRGAQIDKQSQDTPLIDGTVNDDIGIVRGVSGYCAVLLPQLGLDEASVSRPALNTKDVEDTSLYDINDSIVDQSEASLPTGHGNLKPALVKKKSIPSASNLPSSAANPGRLGVNMNSTASFPTYLAALSPSSKSQFVSPHFFGAHNFPTEKTIVLFVTSLLSYLRLLARSVYSDEEQQSHSFAFVILLQVLREVPVALSKLYQVIFAELNTTYNLSLQRNHHLADIVLEAIHECLSSRNKVVSSRPEGSVEDVGVHEGLYIIHSDDDDDSLVERKNIQIKVRPPPAVVEERVSLVSKIRSSIPTLPILEKGGEKDSPQDCDDPSYMVNVMREDVEFHSDEEDEFDSAVDTNAKSRQSLTDSDYLAEIGFSALLSGPYNYMFSSCEKCETWLAPAHACPCYMQRQRTKELVSKFNYCFII